MKCFKDCDIIAALGEITCAGKPRGTRPDDSDLFRALRRFFLLAFFLLQSDVRNKAFETTNADRFAFPAENAIFLALIFLRADTPTDSRQCVRFFDLRHCTRVILFLDERDKTRNIDRYRAALTALRHFAVQAARSFCQCGFFIVAECDLIKIMCANFRVLCRHLVLFH